MGINKRYTRGRPINQDRFEHMADMITFRCDRCDLRTPITVEAPGAWLDDKNHLAGAVAEMIAFHVVNIFPELNGFGGYACLKFVFVRTS